MDASRDPFASLRGLLVLWIVVGHLLLHERFGGIYDAGFARHEDFGALGNLIVLRFLSVDLFFALSGFVLAVRYFDYFTPATRGRDIDRFYGRRLLRIYPMHLAMMALVGLYALLGVPHPITSGNEAVIFNHWQWTGALNLLLMQGWGIIPVASWNEPSWSLSITFFIYAIFPNLLLLLKRLPARAPVYAVLIIGVILAYALQRELFPLGSESDGAGAIVRGAVFATIGATAGLFARTQPLVLFRRHGAWFPALFLSLVMGWTYISPFPITLFHLLYAPLLLGLHASPRRWVHPALAYWLGSRSYALFMAHYPALLLIRHGLGASLAAWATAGTVGKVAAYALTLGLVLLAAELAYRLFDRPFAQLRKT